MVYYITDVLLGRYRKLYNVRRYLIAVRHRWNVDRWWQRIFFAGFISEFIQWWRATVELWIRFGEKRHQDGGDIGVECREEYSDHQQSWWREDAITWVLSWREFARGRDHGSRVDTNGALGPEFSLVCCRGREACVVPVRMKFTFIFPNCRRKLMTCAWYRFIKIGQLDIC